MKNLLLLLTFSLLISHSGFGQKFFTRTGKVSFKSETPIETIEAHNYQVTSLLNSENGEVVFAVLIKSFEFDKALMQEHFNENYMESSKYPKSEFKGKIIDLNKIKFDKEGSYQVQVEGELTMHGVTQKLSVPATIEVKGEKIFASAVLQIRLKDYNIKGMKDKIAESVTVKVDLNYDPYKK
ncbi:MAG: YceI family protein [Cytophagaceae bacterium]